VLKHNVRILASLFSNDPTESLAQRNWVEGLITGDAYLLPVDNHVTTKPPRCFSSLIRAHDTHGYTATIPHQLRGIRAESTSCTPDENDVTLLHSRASLTNQHSISCPHTQGINGCFLPTQMSRLW
jgi:hypothetical protein